MHLLRSRIFWWLFASSGLCAAAAISLLAFLFASQLKHIELRQAEESLAGYAFLADQAIGTAPATGVAERVQQFRPLAPVRVTALDAQGNILADSAEHHVHRGTRDDRPEVIDARRDGAGMAIRTSSSTGQETMYVSRRVTGGSQVVSVVRVSRPLGNIQDEAGGTPRLIWIVGTLTAASVLVLTFWLAWRLAVPLEELTAGAQRIAAGAYGHKVYAGGKDEIGVLSRAFNTMSVRLEEQFAQLEEDRRQLRTVLSGMIEGVVAIDADERILFANDRAAQVLEFGTIQTVGRKLWEVVRQPAINDAVGRALATKSACQEQLDWTGSGVKNLAIHVAPLTGSPTGGAVLVLHDTSNLRRLERVRQEFVANVSHELKTPLSVIKVCVETLLDGAVEDAENRSAFLEQIDEQANRLHLLIIDLLNLARIESGMEVFQLETVAFAEAVATCVERHRARVDAKDQTLEVQDPATNGVAVSAWADEEAVGQILDNLVDNAVKYTPTGGRISVRWHAEEDRVCLEVEDNGIGIPERDLPRVFERFYRVDKARSREMGGTGLGLSIVKHLAQAMQGSVSATSRPGQGSTFRVTLPRAMA